MGHHQPPKHPYPTPKVVKTNPVKPPAISINNARPTAAGHTKMASKIRNIIDAIYANIATIHPAL